MFFQKFILNRHKDEAKLFSLEGRLCLYKVVDVYDGDTCTVIMKNFGKVHKWKVRMHGYDSPEMKPSLKDKNRDIEKAKAILAKEYLINLVGMSEQGCCRGGGGGFVYIKCGKFDKYGRLLGTLYKSRWRISRQKSINQLMIEKGHGYPYDGGTKQHKVFILHQNE